VLSALGPGTYFGDMMLDDGLRSASVMTWSLAGWQRFHERFFASFSRTIRTRRWL